MGFIGNTFSSATDAFLGKDKNAKQATNLETFLTKFSSAEANYVDLIDPLQTFDVTITFFPNQAEDAANKAANGETVGWKDAFSSVGAFTKSVTAGLSRAGTSLVNSAKDGALNALNNMTGGLLATFYNEDNSLATLRETHRSNDRELKRSFLEYVAQYNLLVGSENWKKEFTNDLFGSSNEQTDSGQQQGNKLELELGLYIQNIKIPNFKLNTADKAESLFDSFELPTGMVIPDTHKLTLDILNTKASLHERIFYPWMREVTLPYWSYNTRPYTIATIVIDFTKHNSYKYVFTGCRPIKIDSLQGKQSPDGSAMRQVELQFDFMFIDSDLPINDTVADKLLGTAGTVAKGALALI